MIMVLFSCRAGYREKYDHFILFFKWLLRVLHQEGVVFEELTNINTGEKKKNLRKNNEAELVKQLFVLYQFDKNILYLSSSKKKAIIEGFLEKEIGKKLIVKRFLKTKDEFISILDRTREIRFTEAKNLFNFYKDKTISKALEDLTGIDSPDDLTITAKYNKKYDLIKFISRLFIAKEEKEIKDLIIQGTDESGFDFIFNNDTFTRTIEVKCKKDQNDKFDKIEVKEKLIKNNYQ
jgi:hypothetical protein